MNLKTFGYAAAIAATAVVLAIGSAVPSEAKGKKKVAAPPPPPVFCTLEYKPVCGVKGGVKSTYANACFAAKEGAKVVSSGPCSDKKVTKHKKKGKKKPAKKTTKKK